jgi:FMN reductase
MAQAEAGREHPVVHRAARVLVVGLGGSLAPASRSLAALRVALRGAAEEGADTELLDVGALGLPMYRPSAEAPPTVVHMADLMHRADGLIWSSPMYHGTISGSFKNALDWVQILARDPPYLTDKVIGLISTAGGVQGLQAVNTMEFVVRALRAYAVPLVITVAQAQAAFGDDGRPTDARVEQQLTALGREVARVAWRFREGGHLEQECTRAREHLAAVAAGR